ncbi:transposase [filamentous cyanobacterium CCP1]|nr:transposase [filamentous cyanobacterium CCP2]PSB68556.1 transposase [filamentous cyanobacterium CCP1]
MDDHIEPSNEMAEKFILTYYYVTPEDEDRLKAFRECSGDTEKTLVTQYVRGWLSNNRDYYLGLGRMDAQLRGMSFKDWGMAIVTKGVESLPPYKEEIRDIPPNPLQQISVPPNAKRRSINYITLGKQNVAMLRVGILYDRDNAVGFVSRIVREHLLRNWEKRYKSQVDAENFENWS